MKFDRDTIIGLVICGLIVILWSPISKKFFPPQTAPQQVQTAPVTTTNTITPTANTTVAVPTTENTVATTPAVELPAIPAVELHNEAMSVSIDPASGSVLAMNFNDFRHGSGDEAIRVDKGALAAFSVVFSPAAQPYKVLNSQKIGNEQYSLTREFVSASGQNFSLEQIWTLPTQEQIENENFSPYNLTYKIRIHNPSSSILAWTDLRIEGGELLPWSGLSGDNVRLERYGLDYQTANNEYEAFKVEKSDVVRSAPQVQWAALHNKYFVRMLKSNQPFTMVSNKYQAQGADFTGEVGYFAAVYPNFNVQPGASVELEYSSYTGPKTVSELNKVDSNAGKLMHLAWGPLDWLSRGLLAVLVFLHDSFMFSYGWCIIVLTILVRLLFWPITMKANASMKKMSALQPKMKALRAQYKDQPQILQAKTMELYREEKVNPFSGCLPLLLQIPVFIALYQTLEGAVQLRQVPFWWAHDLAAPDTVAHIFSLPVNPLALAMTILMVLQQRLTPSAMDPMQQKMMMFMPVIMLIFLYNLPSGLTLYWTVSQLFSIGQLLWQRRNEPDGGFKATFRKIFKGAAA